MEPNIRELHADFLAVSTVDEKLIDKTLDELRFENTHSWNSKKSPSRTTINLGWDFVALESGNRHLRGIPDCMVELRAEIFKLFSASIKEGDKPEAFDNIIVTYYKKDEAIEPHVDRDGVDKEGKKRIYSFGETIFGVILKADKTGRLRFIEGNNGDKPPLNSPALLELDEKKGVAFMFQGALRHHPFYHAVSPVSDERISVTFRTTKFVESVR